MSIHAVLTQSRVHFSSALLDFMFRGAAAVADASAHLLVSVCLRTVGQTVTGLPAVETKLEKKKKTRECLRGTKQKKILHYLDDIV